jgi:CheY-like chemotaxis protein
MLKVLFVDDDRPLHETFDLVLSDRCTLLSAYTGAEGLVIFEREAPDVVLLDIDLPDLDGVAVLRRMAARPFPPPVIMLTVLKSDIAHRVRNRKMDLHPDGGLPSRRAAVWPRCPDQVRSALSSKIPAAGAPARRRPLLK